MSVEESSKARWLKDLYRESDHEANGISYEKELARLCYQVFFKTKDGADLLYLLTTKYLKEPIANPGYTEEQARFFEGQVHMIRQFGKSASNFALGKFKDKPTKVRKSRK